MTSELVVMEPTEIAATPAERGVAQFEAYQALQKALDAMMPEQIITIRGRKFRRKGYWRAVAKGFRVTTEIVREERAEVGGDWGYLFVVRATNPGGESAEGDGSCMASEKADGQDTLHNVRAHALTRAKNRAISDLVGFGEVSAEEMGEERAPSQTSRPQFGKRQAQAAAPSQPSLPQSQRPEITEAQARRIVAIARTTGEKYGEHGFHVVGSALKNCGLEPFPPKCKMDDALIHLAEQVAPDAYDEFVSLCEGWQPEPGSNG